MDKNPTVAVIGDHREQQNEWCKAFERGLLVHGVNAVFVQSEERPEDVEADIAVTWGHRDRPLYKTLHDTGREYICLERGYVGDRMDKWGAVGWNGLNGRADFLDFNSPPDRWNENFRDLMKPWRPNHRGYALVIGQVPGDASLENLNIGRWYNETIVGLEHRGIDVRFRQHPLDRQGLFTSGVTILDGSLEDALQGASVVVTLNSNTAVESVLSGIPAISFDEGSMAWDVTTHDLHLPRFYGERSQWAYNMAYCQWTIDEIRSGLVWQHLIRNRGM